MPHPIVVVSSAHPDLASFVAQAPVWAPARLRIAGAAPITGDIGALLDGLEQARNDGPATVVASGDPGFFGIVRALAERFGREALEVHPGPSSVALAFARLGLPWDDAVVVSLHGREPIDVGPLARMHGKLAVLTAPDVAPSSLKDAFDGGEWNVAVFADLGGPAEASAVGGAEVLDSEWADPNVIVAWRGSGVGPKRRTWGLPEDVYPHRAGMVTKSEVRAVVLARLGVWPGAVVWDVGSASGSVAAEAAGLGGVVWAVDRDPAAVQSLREARRPGITVVEGSAPEVLARLPGPDLAFVGGGGLPVLEAVAARRPVRVVATFACVDVASDVPLLLTEAGYDVEASLVAVSRLVPLAGGQRLDAQNPVLIVSGERP